MKKAHADVYFTIGSRHVAELLPCQDYGMAREWKDGCAVVLSDGCSGSPDTDLGSRHLVVNEMVRLHPDNRFGWGMSMEKWIEETLRNTSQVLSPYNTDATLISAKYDNRQVVVELMGDGCVAACYEESMVVYHYGTGNTPPYPSYLCDNSRLLSYLSANPKYEMVGLTTWRHTDMVEVSYADTYPIEGSRDFKRTLTFDAIHLKQLAIFTDGISSFPSPRGMIDEMSYIKKFLDIKAPLGRFAGKRARQVLKELEKSNIRPADDFSIGIIRFDDEETEGAGGPGPGVHTV